MRTEDDAISRAIADMMDSTDEIGDASELRQQVVQKVTLLNRILAIPQEDLDNYVRAYQTSKTTRIITKPSLDFNFNLDSIAKSDPQHVSTYNELEREEEERDPDREGSNAWILQCPEGVYFDWAEGASHETTYKVNRYKDRIQAGDRAFIWVSGKNAGVRAIAKVTEPPGSVEPGYIMVDKNYRLDEHPWMGISPFEFLDVPIPRSEIKEHPLLCQMHIMRMPVGSVFALTGAEAEALDELVEERIQTENWGPGSPSRGFELCQQIAGYLGTALSTTMPELHRWPDIAPDHGEAFSIRSAALPGATCFVRSWGDRCDWGLALDSEARGRANSSHGIDPFLDAIWNHLGDIRENLNWGFSAIPGDGPTFAVSTPEGLSSWVRSAAPWVIRSQTVDLNTQRIDLAGNIASDLILLSSLATVGDLSPTLRSPRPIKVFLSYSRSDYKYVKDQLLPELVSVTGGTVDFIWDDDLSPRSSWDEQLRDWIATCDAALFIVSKDSLDPNRFAWKEEVPELLRRQRLEGIPFKGILRKKIGDKDLEVLHRSGLGLVNADKAKSGQPVFKLGEHRWGVAVARDLIKNGVE